MHHPREPQDPQPIPALLVAIALFAASMLAAALLVGGCATVATAGDGVDAATIYATYENIAGQELTLQRHPLDLAMTDLAEMTPWRAEQRKAFSDRLNRHGEVVARADRFLSRFCETRPGATRRVRDAACAYMVKVRDGREAHIRSYLHAVVTRFAYSPNATAVADSIIALGQLPALGADAPVDVWMHALGKGQAHRVASRMRKVERGSRRASNDVRLPGECTVAHPPGSERDAIDRPERLTYAWMGRAGTLRIHCAMPEHLTGYARDGRDFLAFEVLVGHRWETLGQVAELKATPKGDAITLDVPARRLRARVSSVGLGVETVDPAYPSRLDQPLGPWVRVRVRYAVPSILGEVTVGDAHQDVWTHDYPATGSFLLKVR